MHAKIQLVVANHDTHTARRSRPRHCRPSKCSSASIYAVLRAQVRARERGVLKTARGWNESWCAVALQAIGINSKPSKGSAAQQAPVRTGRGERQASPSSCDDTANQHNAWMCTSEDNERMKCVFGRVSVFCEINSLNSKVNGSQMCVQGIYKSFVFPGVVLRCVVQAEKAFRVDLCS